MKEFNVLIWDFNLKKVVPYNIIPYLIMEYDNADERPTNRDELKQFIIRRSKYQWWSRCEYEIVVTGFPSKGKGEKLDIHYQVEMNIDIITDIFMSLIWKTKNLLE